ncbi:MAG: glucosaminidase domain-containing protein [Bacteroidota bacterium]
MKMDMKHAILPVLFFLVAGTLLHAQAPSKATRQAYIEKYAPIAMREMKRTGIPASITLAQGCLESDNGNSRLATEGNNHFGIKCHDDWQGRKIYHDDDALNECFRQYKSADQSFVDHSDFLTTKQRYAELFELRPDDYRGWAHGLKKAGYATSPTYAEKLIKIIEENDLHRYDLEVLASNGVPTKEQRAGRSSHKAGFTESGREVLVNNQVEYIIARTGDTPQTLRDEMKLYPNEIYRYNELSRDDNITPGDYIYLQPKRNKAAAGFEVHRVQEGESMRSISQKYAIRLDKLLERNQMIEGEEPRPGDEIYLRHPRREPLLKLRPEEEEEPEDVEMRFEFGG